MEATKPEPLSYREELQELLMGYVKHRIEQAKDKPVEPDPILNESDVLDVNDQAVLTDKGVRQLHEALCRVSGMTADQIIADWNRRCPTDPW